MRKVQTSVFRWPAIERMQRIHRLIENKEYPNCRKMAREVEMSVRTLKRDIDFMKTRVSLPIGFDGQHNGYCYTKPVPELESGKRVNGMGALCVEGDVVWAVRHLSWSTI